MSEAELVHVMQLLEELDKREQELQREVMAAAATYAALEQALKERIEQVEAPRPP